MFLIIREINYGLISNSCKTASPRYLQTPVGDNEGRLFLYANAAGHSESGGNGGEHGDYDVEDFTPDVFVFHDTDE